METMMDTTMETITTIEITIMKTEQSTRLIL